MEEEPTKTFEDLEAWKAGREFRIFVFRRIAPILKDLREFVQDDLYQNGRDHFNKPLRILNGYMSWLKRSAQFKGSATEPPSAPPISNL